MDKHIKTIDLNTTIFSYRDKKFQVCRIRQCENMEMGNEYTYWEIRLRLYDPISERKAKKDMEDYIKRLENSNG